MSQWSNLRVLLGCSWSWFALDVAFYGLGLNSSIVLGAIGFGGAVPAGSTPAFKVWKTLNDACIGNLILSAGGLIPGERSICSGRVHCWKRLTVKIAGYWATFAFIDVWGRKKIQLMGFTLLTIICTSILPSLRS